MIKKAALFNDISGFGKCSLTAAIPILSVMGVQPCPAPTAVLTNQSGYSHYHCVDMTDSLACYKEIWTKNNESFDGIYSGYISDKRQVGLIEDFIKAFRKPHTVVLVDPIMGDGGRLYKAYDADACSLVCRLARSADIITPNLTEFSVLTGADYGRLEQAQRSGEIFEMLEKYAKPLLTADERTVIVTGIRSGELICNCLIKRGELYVSRSRALGGSFSGTGDILASIVCAAAVRGDSLSGALDTASGFIEEAAADTVREKYDRNDGINFEKFLYKLHEKGAYSNEQSKY